MFIYCVVCFFGMCVGFKICLNYFLKILFKLKVRKFDLNFKNIWSYVLKNVLCRDRL